MPWSRWRTAFGDVLSESGLFETVEVEHTDDPDQLVVGLCRLEDSVSEDVVGVAVQRLWRDHVSYPFWEIHSIKAEDDHVELHGATRESIVGGYVTVRLVAHRPSVPAQRTSLN